MNMQVQSNYASYAFRVNTDSVSTGSRAAPAGAAATGSAAYVCVVDPAVALASQQDSGVNSALSQSEYEDLLSTYLELGEENILWGDIGSLLSEELAGADRANFLSVLADAGPLIEDFVTQVKSFEGDDRSLFLSTALRAGSGRNLENLIGATAKLSADQRTFFLEAADLLSRTRETAKAGDLQNFIAAVAESPTTLQDIIRNTEELGREDLSRFLKGAAGAGDALESFIRTADMLEGAALTHFLESAVMAEDGLENLLSLTQETAGKGRADFLRFTSRLDKENIENFLRATQGDKESVEGLMATTTSLEGSERADFLTLAADAGLHRDRFVSMTDRLAENPGTRSNFLSAALVSGNSFNKVLNVAESLGQEQRSDLFRFASDLDYVDLSNFISAVDSAPSNASDLVAAADGLIGKNKSYLFYAAAQNPDHIEALSSMAQTLEGSLKNDFLYTAANIGKDSPEEAGKFIAAAQDLKGTALTNFLTKEKAAAEGDEPGLAQEYVYLNGVLGENRMEALIAAGEYTQDFNGFLEDFNAMTQDQRETFLSVADKAGEEVLGTFMGVASSLDATHSEAFLAYADTLGETSLNNLIQASAEALGGGQGFNTFESLLETAQSLNPVEAQDFLNAAAASKESLESLIDITNELSGFVKTEFLTVADYIADLDGAQSLMDHFVTTTQGFLDKDSGYSQVLKNGGHIKQGVRPSDLIENGIFTGGSETGFLKSTQFLTGTGISGSRLHRWFDSWQKAQNN
ncbi:MAG: hypothetical protein MI799_20330 [Desulfobacterales bacterium]|nr:hypothetical protein [Desulfobacterales bacterium]